MMYVTRRLIVRSHQLGTASSRMVSHLATLVLFVTAAAALSLPYGCSPPPEREDALYSIARWEDRRLADIDSLGQMISADDAHVRRAAVRAAGL